jgi:hypothetical protein
MLLGAVITYCGLVREGPHFNTDMVIPNLPEPSSYDA